MIGLLIVTHGNFAMEILRSAELIMGKQVCVDTLSLNEEDDIERFKVEVGKKIEMLDTGKGVLVLSDLFGGSPSNATIANMRSLNFESLTGLNLPMLIEGLNLRESCSLEELTDQCYTAGIEGIKDVKKAIHI